jgi:uncharacterized protein (DUF849 family)
VSPEELAAEASAAVAAGAGALQAEWGRIDGPDFASRLPDGAEAAGNAELVAAATELTRGAE